MQKVLGNLRIQAAKRRSFFSAAMLLCALPFAAAEPCRAEGPALGAGTVAVGPAAAGRGRILKDPRSPIVALRNYSVSNFFDTVVDVSDDKGSAPAPAQKIDANTPGGNGSEAATAKAASPQVPAQQVPAHANAPAPAAPGTAPQAESPDARASLGEGVPLKKPGPVFVEKFKPGDLLPPEVDPRVRINPEAPPCFIGMATAHEEGDEVMAARYADCWVRYQQNIFFKVRDLTKIIGQSLIRQKVIEEGDWDGVEQYIDYEMARTREIRGEVFKPTHDKAMERIKPDPKGKADVYFFFTMNCSYCRFMAPDVERLWQVLKNDPNVRMTAVTLGPYPQSWLDDYREYTGATFPVKNGEDLAKAFNLKFVPALVVMAPNAKAAYFKSGQQSFTNMYDFVRHVQGMPSTITTAMETLSKTPIGQVENERAARGEWNPIPIVTSDGTHLQTVKVDQPRKESTTKTVIERF